MLAILLGGCSSVPGAVAESISMAYNRAGYAKCDLSPALRDGTNAHRGRTQNAAHRAEPVATARIGWALPGRRVHAQLTAATACPWKRLGPWSRRSGMRCEWHQSLKIPGRGSHGPRVRAHHRPFAAGCPRCHAQRGPDSWRTAAAWPPRRRAPQAPTHGPQREYVAVPGSCTSRERKRYDEAVRRTAPSSAVVGPRCALRSLPSRLEFSLHGARWQRRRQLAVAQQC